MSLKRLSLILSRFLAQFTLDCQGWVARPEALRRVWRTVKPRPSQSLRACQPNSPALIRHPFNSRLLGSIHVSPVGLPDRFWPCVLPIAGLRWRSFPSDQATRRRQPRNPPARARKLAETTEDTAKSLPQLIRSLDDSDTDVRRLAANALGDLGSKAMAAVPALEKRLEDQEENVRLVSAWALANIDPTNAAPVQVLILSVREGNPRSIVALGQLGPTAVEAVPALVDALRSENSLVQAQAIKALEKIGPKAKAALPALNRFAKSQNEDLRTAAKKAITAIEP